MPKDNRGIFCPNKIPSPKIERTISKSQPSLLKLDQENNAPNVIGGKTSFKASSVGIKINFGKIHTYCDLVEQMEVCDQVKEFEYSEELKFLGEHN